MTRSANTPTEAHIPAIDLTHPVILFNLKKTYRPDMTDDELYEATRKSWRVGGERRRLGGRAAPVWAMAVFDGIIRAVYRIEGWEQAPRGDQDADVPDEIHWAFRGWRDPNMETRYCGRDVSDETNGPGRQNPIRYVNCS